MDFVKVKLLLIFKML